MQEQLEFGIVSFGISMKKKPHSPRKRKNGAFVVVQPATLPQVTARFFAEALSRHKGHDLK
jgi:hypothetical protein